MYYVLNKKLTNLTQSNPIIQLPFPKTSQQPIPIPQQTYKPSLSYPVPDQIMDFINPTFSTQRIHHACDTPSPSRKCRHLQLDASSSPKAAAEDGNQQRSLVDDGETSMIVGLSSAGAGAGASTCNPPAADGSDQDEDAFSRERGVVHPSTFP